MKFTICAYDGQNYFGGPLEWYKRIAPEWRNIGVDTEFLFITDHHPKKCNTYNFLKRNGFRCKALKRHSLSQIRDNTESRVKWILTNLKKRLPDVFISNLSVPACYAGKWAQDAGIPVVPVIHSVDEFYQGIVHQFFKKESEFSLNSVVCVSKEIERWVESENKRKIFIERIPCGTPIPVKKAKWNNERFRIVYVGRLTEKAKKIRLMTKAFCDVVLSYKDVEAFIIGNGPERSSVEQIIQTHKCENKISLLGQIESNNIQEELLKCHAIVLMSDFEGLPIALLEGMACGLVPVCLDIRSGIPELVKHMKTGLLVKNRDNDFLAAIQKLKNDATLWQKLSENARELVVADYSMQHVAKKWKEYAKNLKQDFPKKQAIKVPRRLHLPSMSDGLSGDDRRWPGWAGYLAGQYSRVIRIVGRYFL